MHNYQKDYPRPQLVRDNFTLLNGAWDFAFDDDKKGMPADFDRTIQVPFTYETVCSGIGDETFHPLVWYRRNFTVESGRLRGQRLILNFEGVDFLAKVWVNGRFVGSHQGAYSRFGFDITGLVHEGENELIVSAEDNFDMSQPRGKQRWKKDNFGCWYVQTTGIWKSVWMEYVGEVHIKNLKITPNWQKKSVILEADITGGTTKEEYAFGTGTGGNLVLGATITFGDLMIRTAAEQVLGGKVKMELELERPDLFEWAVFTWAPDHPDLYDVELSLRDNGKNWIM